MRRCYQLGVLVILMLAGVSLAAPALTRVPIRDVRIDDPFWSPKREVWRTITINDCFDKFEKDGAIANFDHVRDGSSKEHGGPPWYDGLIYEMITGSADFLAEHPDPALEKRIDGYIERITAAAAKDPDGYLNTFTQLKEPSHRFGQNGGNDLWQHDLYNAGCMAEAGVRYYRATGKTTLLRTATRLANYMCEVMGPPPRKNLIPGHAVGEMAMVELYRLYREHPELKKEIPFAVDEKRFLELAEFWIDARGNHQGRKSFGAYDQDDVPVLQQEAIEGHAVRATLMASGLTDLASTMDRADYRREALRLWENMAKRRMYVTGGVGAVAGEEKFGADYFLPNNGYLETCAAVGAGFFDERMNLDLGEARFADELERELYNGALCGVSISGNRYFYENPLESSTNRLRWAWHSCPCCPPMFLKLMGALPSYVYATDAKGLYVNLYVGSTLIANVGGHALKLHQETRYPWAGDARFTIQSDEPAEVDLAFRIPGWCQGANSADALYKAVGRPESGAFAITVNGQAAAAQRVNGYAKLHRRWAKGDVVEIHMLMLPRRILANPKVAADRGKVALSLGPVMYCLESADNQGRVRNLSLPDDALLGTEFRADLLGGVTLIHAQALASSEDAPAPKTVELTAIPYYANANRGPVSMAVWMPRLAKDAEGQAAVIRVNAKGPARPVSRYLTGACIEDVNHEIYGGIYSQMIFGESFQEPARQMPIKGFVSPDGQWRVKNGELEGSAGAGPKLISTGQRFTTGQVGVEVFLGGKDAGNGGLILRAGRAGAGADNFDGYEVAIDLAHQCVVVGRHQHDFHLLQNLPCDVAADRWISLEVMLGAGSLDVSIDGKNIGHVEDPHPLPAGSVGLRQWQRTARYRNLWVKTDGRRMELPFEAQGADAPAISGMWGAVSTGSAALAASIETQNPFTGAASQRLTFAGGQGEVGIENQGLNRWGMALEEGKSYEGSIWARAEKPLELFATVESRDGSKEYARTTLSISGNDWRRYEFALTPGQSDPAGRFSLRLRSPGSVVLGHVFLQPGDWGRFKGLPLRRDVVQGLIDQGITALRYGGSMANAPEYRWKKMVGPRDRRPPYRGTWYGHSTNGWGIIDFLDLCEAAGFVGIPDFNIDESPQDMADFAEYVNGSADSPWGKRRAADGHPAPYKLRQIELGNEERINDVYVAKFEKLAKAIWSKDPDIILVVGDFQYERPITDPLHIEGAASRIRSLEGQKKILELAKQNNREVWFDVHVWTEGPGISTSRQALSSYVDAIDHLADGAKHAVVVFELNANNHDQRRALSNAEAINAVMNDGRLPVCLSANCLQCDGQNDNGWDQGLLFLNPSKVWLQPPGYVTQILSRNYQPLVLQSSVEGGEGMLSVGATRSEDGKTIVLRVVNLDSKARGAQIHLEGFEAGKAKAQVEELAGPLGAENSAGEPKHLAPTKSDWDYEPRDGAAMYVFKPYSFTVIRVGG